MASSPGAFVVVSLPAFLAAWYLFDGILLPTVAAVFCGFAAAAMLNATNIMARRTKRDRTGDETGTDTRNDLRRNGRVS